MACERMDLKVMFGEISIRSYDRALADHPAVSSGPGLSISWRYEEGPTLPVDEFEVSRSISRKTSYLDLVVPRVERERILREECGYARSDIAQCVRSVNAAKHRRRQTIDNLSMEPCEEAWQQVFSGFTSCFRRRRNSEKDMKELWVNAQTYEPKNNKIDRPCKGSSRSSLKHGKKTDETAETDKTEIVKMSDIDVSDHSAVSDITSVVTETLSTLSSVKAGTKLRNITAEEEVD